MYIYISEWKADRSSEAIAHERRMIVIVKIGKPNEKSPRDEEARGDRTEGYGRLTEKAGHANAMVGESGHFVAL